MNPPRRAQSQKDTLPESSTLYEKISCQTEADLSEGSTRILRQKKHELFAFLRWKLINHRLQTKYSEWEIFCEAYHRATTTIRKGNGITNLYAWYKSTGYNVIREYSRKEIRQRDLKNKLESVAANHRQQHGSDHHSCGLEPDSEIFNTITATVRNKTDIKIICLRVLQELSWVEVCEVLISEGDLNCELSKQCVERVRQRFHRALKKIPKFK